MFDLFVPQFFKACLEAGGIHLRISCDEECDEECVGHRECSVAAIPGPMKFYPLCSGLSIAKSSLRLTGFLLLCHLSQERMGGGSEQKLSRWSTYLAQKQPKLDPWYPIWYNTFQEQFLSVELIRSNP